MIHTLECLPQTSMASTKNGIDWDLIVEDEWEEEKWTESEGTELVSNKESETEEIQSGSKDKKRKQSTESRSTGLKLSMKSPKERKSQEQLPTELKKTFSSSEHAEKFRRKWKERKDKEEEKKWREMWDEIRKEMELELKGRGRLSKEMYYRMGKILIDFKKGKKDIPRHRSRTAIKVYLTYKDNEEFNDGIKIREINKEKKAGLKELTRKKK